MKQASLKTSYVFAEFQIKLFTYIISFKMSELKYNYVFFNTPDNNTIKRNPDGYFTICTVDLESNDNVVLVSYPLDYSSRFVRILYALHNAKRINQKVDLPLKSLWYPYYFKNTFKTRKPICFIILNPYLSVDYLFYLKRKYKDCKIVLLHRDLRIVTERSNPDFKDNPVFDLTMTINQNEADKYGWVYFSEFESKIDVPKADAYPLSDIFFAGKVKDRLPKLLTAYEILSKAGLKCHYYLTGVPAEQRIDLPGIEYAEANMSYKEMLYHTVNTRCVLEFNQTGATGYTSRFLEAVIFGKKLITDNPAILESPFYAHNRIQFVKEAKDINPSFVTEGNDDVDYHYCGEFSPLRLIEQIDKLLV